MVKRTKTNAITSRARPRKPRRKSTPAPSPYPPTDGLSPEAKRFVEQKLVGMASVLQSRAQLAQSMGKTFGGERDLYQAAGYPLTISFEDYGVKFERLGIARRVVSAYPDQTWSHPPSIRDGDGGGDATDFEKAITQLVKDLRLWHYIRRIDTMSGIGRYADLFLGFDDGEKFNLPVKPGAKLLYLQPYTEGQSEPVRLVSDKDDPRYGLPEAYEIRMGSESDDLTTTVAKAKSTGHKVVVHWSRVLHVADHRITSDVYGTPRMKPVYNELINIETLMAGATEMFWKGGFPGYTFEAREGTNLETQAMEDIQEEIETYFHGLQRYLRIQGMDVKPMTVQVASPKDHLLANIQLISAETGIPARILLGSEQGELASSQDKGNWMDRVDERRLTYAEPLVLRPLVDHLIDIKVLPTPAEDEYTVDWPELLSASDDEKAQVAERITKAIATYVSAPGADLLVPPFHFFTVILGMDPDEVREMLDEGQGLAEAERKQEEEEVAMRKADELERATRDADLARELAGKVVVEGAAA